MLKYEDILNQMGKEISIYPLSVESIQGSSVDLLAGEYAWSIVTKKSVVSDTPNGKEIKIAPKDIVIVYSNEVVSVDQSIAGTLHSKIIWTSHGIFMNSTTLDPGYTGNFMFTFYNSGDKEIVWSSGKTPIATLVFFNVNGKTKFQVKTKTLQLRALNSIGIVPDSHTSGELDAQWRNSPEDVRLRLKNSAEYSELKQLIEALPKIKAKDIFNKWIVPIGLIVLVIGIFLSNLPTDLKTAIPSIIALVALIRKRG